MYKIYKNNVFTIIQHCLYNIGANLVTPFALINNSWEKIFYTHISRRWFLIANQAGIEQSGPTHSFVQMQLKSQRTTI